MCLLRSIYQYPVKGLSGQPLPHIKLATGEPFPDDRRFALARAAMPMQDGDTQWARKGSFVMLMLEERLAEVNTHLDTDTLEFVVRSGNRRVLAVDLNDPAAITTVEEFFHRLVPALPRAPRLVRSKNGHFMDKPDNVISMMNLATLRSLEAQWGNQIDPMRFRANLYVDTGKPWEEFEWIGRNILIGSVLFRVDRRNGRCGATNVNPVSGARDMDIPRSLRASFGHKDLGVYLMVAEGGTIAVNDALVPPQTIAPVAPASIPTAAHPGRRYICRGCYFIYSEDAGIPADDVPPGTSPQQLSDTYRCPDCGTDKAKLHPYPTEAAIVSSDGSRASF
jgi:GntR family transcriptional regulator / MocR family aminotransferase